MESFTKLGLSEQTVVALQKKGFTEPTDIQKQAIPLLLEGKVDVLGQSQTGTGKTASFALPIIEKLKPKAKHVQAIVLAPTRELAVQVSKEIESLQGKKKFSILAVYGGTSINDQLRKLKKGVDIVVGTPGRVIDHIKRKSLDLSKVSFAVLDEADEMLNMGFVDDIKRILSSTPDNKRMLLFSATMPKQVRKIAQQFMRKHVTLHVKKEQVTQKLTDQIYYDINARDRFEALRRLIDSTDNFYAIIFCKMKSTVDTLTQKLNNAKYKAAALHGDISQAQREKILLQFRKKNVTLLVATDVAARGIDVNDLTHVVNYSMPQSPESYVHRIGRTGRAGKKGTAITFVIPSERRMLRFVEKIAKTTLRKEELPSIQDVIDLKKENMFSKVEKQLAKPNKSFRKIGQELLARHAPLELVTALLGQAFSASLDPHNYKEIKKVSARDHRGSRRDNKFSDKGGKRRSSRGKRENQGRGDSFGKRRDKKSNSKKRSSRKQDGNHKKKGKGSPGKMKKFRK